MPAPFSRIALAAALIEYDNDLEDPTKPRRSAQESAIFSHLRRSGPVPKPQSVLGYDDLPYPRRSKDYLGVPLALDESGPMRGSTLDSTHNPPVSTDPRGSLDILREYGEEYFEKGPAPPSESDESDVDLTSWGLDSLMPPKTSKDKDKVEKKPGPSRIRPASEHLDNLELSHDPQSATGLNFDISLDNPRRSNSGARPTSMLAVEFGSTPMPRGEISTFRLLLDGA
ncbi:hypothetical protein BS47DRAFT_123495 [Hydnum rufescens UP504]|uniref:Uncharacterized protein n=1 Tax=Hydnum rufescens UP504 TaxID=1448309 RepID=A0A9P6B7I1_9AGAM|nr:hypothetical protein BS47DRAFT_123495 [Hydnum rufescens UP504]